MGPLGVSEGLMKGGALVMGLVPLIEEEKPELSSLSAMGGHRKRAGSQQEQDLPAP